MEASVATPPTQAPPAEPTPSYDGAAEATRSAEELFQYSGFVHTGRGAAECEHAIDGACRDAQHFHAWVCLPNQFQIRDISDKARAARARRKRALRDPESDAHAMLEEELYELRTEKMDELIEELARGEVDDRILDIVRDLHNTDERFEHHDQDAEELRRLQELPEDERDPEEFERLQSEMIAYADQLNAVVTAEQQKAADRLRALPADDVVEIERRHRIDAQGTEAYLHAYYTWAMFVCARKPSTEPFPSERKFATPEALKTAPPEAIIAVREKIRDLETATTTRSDAAGN